MALRILLFKNSIQFWRKKYRISFCNILGLWLVVCTERLLLNFQGIQLQKINIRRSLNPKLPPPNSLLLDT